MKLKEHDIELAERMEMLDMYADKQLAKELLELHSSKCIECQEDRLSCTVRPACKNRNFLNALIEMGVEPQDLPDFCYTQYLEKIRRFIIEKKGRGIKDRRVPIKDLLSTLRLSSIRQFNSKFKREWKKYSTFRGHDVMLVVGDDLLFHFDFARGLVIINPDNYNIDRAEILSLYIEVLKEHYKSNVTFEKLTSNWWVLKFKTRKALSKTKLDRITDMLTENFEAYNIKTSDGSVEIDIEILSVESHSTITVGELNGLFVLIKKTPRTTTSNRADMNVSNDEG